MDELEFRGYQEDKLMLLTQSRQIMMHHFKKVRVVHVSREILLLVLWSYVMCLLFFCRYTAVFFLGATLSDAIFESNYVVYSFRGSRRWAVGNKAFFTFAVVCFPLWILLYFYVETSFLLNEFLLLLTAVWRPDQIWAPFPPSENDFVDQSRPSVRFQQCVPPEWYAMRMRKQDLKLENNSDHQRLVAYVNGDQSFAKLGMRKELLCQYSSLGIRLYAISDPFSKFKKLRVMKTVMKVHVATAASMATAIQVVDVQAPIDMANGTGTAANEFLFNRVGLTYRCDSQDCRDFLESVDPPMWFADWRATYPDDGRNAIPAEKPRRMLHHPEGEPYGVEVDLSRLAFSLNEPNLEGQADIETIDEQVYYHMLGYSRFRNAGYTQYTTPCYAGGAPGYGTEFLTPHSYHLWDFLLACSKYSYDEISCTETIDFICVHDYQPNPGVCGDPNSAIMREMYPDQNEREWMAWSGCSGYGSLGFVHTHLADFFNSNHGFNIKGYIMHEVAHADFYQNLEARVGHQPTWLSFQGASLLDGSHIAPFADYFTNNGFRTDGQGFFWLTPNDVLHTPDGQNITFDESDFTWKKEAPNPDGSDRFFSSPTYPSGMAANVESVHAELNNQAGIRLAMFGFFSSANLRILHNCIEEHEEYSDGGPILAHCYPEPRTQEALRCLASNSATMTAYDNLQIEGNLDNPNVICRN
eukprot:gene242-451_t